MNDALRQTAAKHGAWALLVFYLVGAIPGLPSPFDKLTTLLTAHDTKADLQLKVLRGICYRLPRPVNNSDPRYDCE